MNNYDEFFTSLIDDAFREIKDGSKSDNPKLKDYYEREGENVGVSTKEEMMSKLTKHIIILDHLKQLVEDTNLLIDESEKVREGVTYSSQIDESYYIIYTTEIIDYDIDYENILENLKDQIFENGNGTYNAHDINGKIMEKRLPYYGFKNSYIVHVEQSGDYTEVADVVPYNEDPLTTVRIKNPMLYMKKLSETYKDILDNKKFVLHNESLDSTLAEFCKYHMRRLQKD